MHGCLVLMNGSACSGKTTLSKQLQRALCSQFMSCAPDVLRHTHVVRVWHIELDFFEQQVRESKQEAQHSWSQESWKAAQKLGLETTCAIMKREASSNDDMPAFLINLFVSGQHATAHDGKAPTFDVVLVDDNMLKRSSRKKYWLAALENQFAFFQICMQTPLDICIARNMLRKTAAKEQAPHVNLLVSDAIVKDTHTHNEVRSF